MKEGEEEDGFTILEFSRKYITCDDDDQPIVVSNSNCLPTPFVNWNYSFYLCCWHACDNSLQTETARVIWAFHTTDDPMSEELTFSLIHSEKGSVSLNLLGGLPDVVPDPEDLQYFDIAVDNVRDA